MSSGDGVSSPSTMCTASRYWFTAISSRNGPGTLPGPLSLSTNHDRPNRHRARIPSSADDGDPGDGEERADVEVAVPSRRGKQDGLDCAAAVGARQLVAGRDVEDDDVGVVAGHELAG